MRSASLRNVNEAFELSSGKRVRYVSLGLDGESGELKVDREGVGRAVGRRGNALAFGSVEELNGMRLVVGVLYAEMAWTGEDVFSPEGVEWRLLTLAMRERRRSCRAVASMARCLGAVSSAMFMKRSSLSVPDTVLLVPRTA